MLQGRDVQGAALVGNSSSRRRSSSSSSSGSGSRSGRTRSRSCCHECVLQRSSGSGIGGVGGDGVARVRRAGAATAASAANLGKRSQALDVLPEQAHCFATISSSGRPATPKLRTSERWDFLLGCVEDVDYYHYYCCYY